MAQNKEWDKLLIEKTHGTDPLEVHNLCFDNKNWIRVMFVSGEAICDDAKMTRVRILPFTNRGEALDLVKKALQK